MRPGVQTGEGPECSKGGFGQGRANLFHPQYHPPSPQTNAVLQCRPQVRHCRMDNGLLSGQTPKPDLAGGATPARSRMGSITSAHPPQHHPPQHHLRELLSCLSAHSVLFPGPVPLLASPRILQAPTPTPGLAVFLCAGSKPGALCWGAATLPHMTPRASSCCWPHAVRTLLLAAGLMRCAPS